LKTNFFGSNSSSGYNFTIVSTWDPLYNFMILVPPY
jgi:hypothetical protein